MKRVKAVKIKNKPVSAERSVAITELEDVTGLPGDAVSKKATVRDIKAYTNAAIAENLCRNQLNNIEKS